MSDLEQRLQAASTGQNQEQLWANTGKLEGRYLRFLRTPNRIDDYQTIKTIGKGAFAEVKLVRRKHDAKVYALKSLLKTQTVAQSQYSMVRSERDSMFFPKYFVQKDCNVHLYTPRDALTPLAADR